MKTVYQSNISIFHKSLDLLISSILNNNNNNNNNDNDNDDNDNDDDDDDNTKFD